MTERRSVLVTGATGFIGGAVVRASPEWHRIRAASRSSFPSSSQRKEWVAADLTTQKGINAALGDAASLVHCVSYVGPDREAAWRVNFEVARDLVRTAVRRGIHSLVYVSTSGVYGPGVKRGADESYPIRPSSEASRARRAAEEIFLAAGGTVIRPHLVYGVGDKWVLPQLSRVAATSGLPDGGQARVSLIDVDSLAGQVWMLWEQGPAVSGQAFNTFNGPPVSLKAVVDEVRARIPSQTPRDAEGAGDLSGHQREMLTLDNWFASSLPQSVVPAFRLTDPMVKWYTTTTIGGYPG